MSNHTEQLRVVDLNTSFGEVVAVLAEGNPGALQVMMEMLEGGHQMQLLALDALHLYGPHIWLVYKDVCGEDLDRFLYHLAMELPCQVCGVLSITGPHAADLSEDANHQWFESRKHGGRGKYWALATPPQSRTYRYPLTPSGHEPSADVPVEAEGEESVTT